MRERGRRKRGDGEEGRGRGKRGRGRRGMGGREGRGQQGEVNFDGSHNVTLYTGDKVIIERAVRATGIVKLNKASFLEVLHKKLSV